MTNTSVETANVHGAAEGKSKVSGLLSEPLAKEIIEGITAPNLYRAFDDALYWFTKINRAHLVMLSEQGLIEVEVAGRLLQHISDLDQEGSKAFSLDPEREDPWFNYEAELTRRAGPEAGRLHMARSRNDLKKTQERMRCIKLAEELVAGSLAIREALLERAKAEVDTVMPGYTHLQHAQPITFGWYLLGIEAALSRDTSRIESALVRMNNCPLGAGAFAGTRFSINRERTAELLGFDGVQQHSMDAVGNRDAMVELMSAAMQLSMTIGRMSQDFYLWATYEFGMLEFPDRVASTSSIMPQKKNLTVLENLKARPTILLGAMSTAVATLRAVPFGHSQEVSIDSARWVWDSLEELKGILPAARVVVECATPRKERMKDLAGENFCTATALADLLSSRYGLPFRQAHHITGRYVRLVLDGNSPQEAIRGAYEEETGQPLDDIETLLVEALDPAGILDATTGCGPSRAESDVLHRDGLTRLEKDRKASAERLQRRASAELQLNTVSNQLVRKAAEEMAVS
ncbi:argininosuccinate lyase [Marinobacterium lutimaris]|uniref:Argininosuccinate lyase n=1 Tax=Marinobacterium lutimaris TaxID=568106 RepID=A0A1H6CAT7_9GAMM|nr:argininosuccinate lyase [Marinobacterium lutimaris]SEG70064.1 argininosuccinate lyase [Marinobacterium lutimaris]